MYNFEKKFWDILSSLFVGAKVEGKSGYISLMKAKSKYFETVKTHLQNDINEVLRKNPDFKDELYNKLYSFFHRYFSESGSIYYTYTPFYYKIYTKAYDSNITNEVMTYDTDFEQITTDKQDTALFYKTSMLYYVKTDRIIRSLEVEINGVKIAFDVSNMEHKKANEKKSLIYELGEIAEDKITIVVAYKEGNRTTKTVAILKELKKAKISIDEEKFTKSIQVFEKQANIDYFINKDAKKFLTEQLEMWIYQYMFREETDFDVKRYEQIKSLKRVASNLVNFISQFENELVRIWNKPRFAINSNIVVTLDRLIEKGFDIEKLKKHSGFTTQKREWEELGLATENGLLENNYLPIDTKYFADLKDEIEALFDDSEFDGLLIKSENYQALNTILPRFKNKIKTIYIDPPYNAPASEILYLNNYKRSSWLAMMENRLNLAKHFLTKDGIFECAIDKNEQESLGLLLDGIFPEKEKVCVTIIHNPGGVQGDNFSYSHEFTYFMYPKSSDAIKKIKRDESNIESLRDWGGEESKRETAKNCFYPIFVSQNNEIIGFGDVCDEDFHPEQTNIKTDNEIIAIYPIDKSGIERKWRYARQSIENIRHQLVVKDNNGIKSIQNKKSYFRPKTVWDDKIYNANEYGSKLLNNIVPNNGFDFPKSIYNVQDCIKLASKEDSIILDFFPGSGTTAHAIMDLNKNDENSKQKFILTEMGEHFYTVILPRVKKIAFASEYKKGIAQDNNGIGICIKYYELEQYEQILQNLTYDDVSEDWKKTIKDIYGDDIFLFDGKLSKAIKVEDGKVKINLDEIYPNIDIKETLHNLTGKRVKSISDESVEFMDGTKKETLSLLKPLLVW